MTATATTAPRAAREGTVGEEVAEGSDGCEYGRAVVTGPSGIATVATSVRTPTTGAVFDAGSRADESAGAAPARSPERASRMAVASGHRASRPWDTARSTI